LSNGLIDKLILMFLISERIKSHWLVRVVRGNRQYVLGNPVLSYPLP